MTRVQAASRSLTHSLTQLLELALTAAHSACMSVKFSGSRQENFGIISLVNRSVGWSDISRQLLRAAALDQINRLSFTRVCTFFGWPMRCSDETVHRRQNVAWFSFRHRTAKKEGKNDEEHFPARSWIRHSGIEFRGVLIQCQELLTGTRRPEYPC